MRRSERGKERKKGQGKGVGERGEENKRFGEGDAISPDGRKYHNLRYWLTSKENYLNSNGIECQNSLK